MTNKTEWAKIDGLSVSVEEYPIVDDIRRLVIKHLHTSNPDESIVGSCNNAYQIIMGQRELIALRDEQIAQLTAELELMRSRREER